MTNNKNAQKDTLEIDLWSLFRYLWKKLWIIVLVVIIAASAAFISSNFISPRQYQSITKVYILNRPKSTGVPTYNDWMLSELITGDYEELIKSKTVMDKVIEELDLDMTAEQLAGTIDVYAGEESRILEISVKTGDPELSCKLANKVRDVSSKSIVKIMNIDAVNVIDAAKPNYVAVSPDVPGDTVKGAVLGLIVSIIALVVKFILDDSLRTSEDIKNYLNLSVLGIIPYEGNPKDIIKNDFKRKFKKLDKFGK